jgi:hypothetical protein
MRGLLHAEGVRCGVWTHPDAPPSVWVARGSWDDGVPIGETKR